MALPPFSSTTPNATSTLPGKVQLTGDLGGLATAPTTPTAVHLTGTETISGTKIHSNTLDSLSADIKVISSTSLTDQTPTMTSNILPSGVASASTEANSGNAAWNVFDKSTTTKWTTLNVTTGWVKYDFLTKRVLVSQYGITGPVSGQATKGPKTWTFEGSNDGTTWIVLDTQTNAPSWGVLEQRTYTIANHTGYRSYRLNISANQGDVLNLSLVEFQLNTETVLASVDAAGNAIFGDVVATTLYDRGSQFINVKAYGAIGDGTTDDTNAILAANAALTSGVLYFPPGTYLVTNPIPLKTGTMLLGANAGASVIKTSGSTFISGSRGAIEIGLSGAVSNINLEKIGFNSGTGNYPVIISGATNVTLRDCLFTGSGTSSHAVLITETTNTSGVKILASRFVNMPNSASIKISALNGNTVKDVLIEGNHFENIWTTGVQIDDGSGTGSDIKVLNNTFIDLIGDQVFGHWATAVYGGLNTVYKYSNVLVEGNYYKNSRAGNEQQGFAWLYQMTDVKIKNNTAIGSSTYQANQIFLAPGRVSNPIIGLKVSGNYIDGWTAYNDFDATSFAEFDHNEIRNCQVSFTFGTGYNVQTYLDIHHNKIYNCFNHEGSGLEGFIALENSSPTGVKIHENLFVEDTATRHIKYAIQCSGPTFDFSDVEIYNNKFYMPNNDLEAFLSRQAVTVTYPRRIENNTVIQASGVFNYKQVIGNATTGNIVQQSQTFAGANLTLSVMATPTAPTTAVVGTTGSTSYNYKIVAVNADGTDGLPSAASTTLTTGNATLTTSNYNTVSWPVVSGAKGYKVLRSVSAGAYQILTYANNSLADATTSGLSIKDQGQYTASTYTPVGSSPGGSLTLGVPLAIGSGGTGSATQNFVDLTTNQTAAGNKTWSGIGAITINDALTTTPTFNLQQSGAGDVSLQFLAVGARRYVMGIDQSDSTKFKLGNTTDLGSGTALLTIDPTGGGKVGIAQTSPTASLHLPAGTASASTAPLKLTSGTNLTTPEAGAIEFDGSHFYGTISSTRYQLDQQTSFATLTKFK